MYNWRRFCRKSLVTISNFDLENVVLGQKDYNFGNGDIRWQISKSMKVVCCMLAPALIVSEILTFEIFVLDK